MSAHLGIQSASTPRASNDPAPTFDLFEDVLTKIKFGKLSRAGEHSELRRVMVVSPQQHAELRVGLIEALAAIESHAKDCFGFAALHHGEHFESIWKDEDPADYARWVRLKALAGSV